ncbi:MAG: hypothetical protein KDI75_04680 [Xanthomonadales bacterium]|nr:hypothetical protein [Xanthomonadales bacterium]
MTAKPSLNNHLRAFVQVSPFARKRCTLRALLLAWVTENRGPMRLIAGVSADSSAFPKICYIASLRFTPCNISSAAVVFTEPAADFHFHVSRSFSDV